LRLALPAVQLPTVADRALHFRRFRLQGKWHLLKTALYRAKRKCDGRHPDTSAAILDCQSGKTIEESAGVRGYDAHQCVKGSKRQLLVDTLGLPITCYLTSADIHDTHGARRLLAGLKHFVPWFKKIWADAAYRGQDLADRCTEHGDWNLEVVERKPGTHGFRIQPRRWVVVRSFAGLIRNRRLA
jgi:putative transposase